MIQFKSEQGDALALYSASIRTNSPFRGNPKRYCGRQTFGPPQELLVLGPLGPVQASCLAGGLDLGIAIQ